MGQARSRGHSLLHRRTGVRRRTIAPRHGRFERCPQHQQDHRKDVHEGASRVRITIAALLVREGLSCYKVNIESAIPSPIVAHHVPRHRHRANSHELRHVRQYRGKRRPIERRRAVLLGSGPSTVIDETSQRTPNLVCNSHRNRTEATGINTSINAVADVIFCRLRTSSPRQLRLCLERVTETIHCEFYCLIKLRSDHTGPHYPRTTVTPHYAHGARRVHTTRPCRAETPLSGSGVR